MAYKPRDRIFAKVKGFPHWPARINVLPEDATVPKGKYPIFFYGTHEIYNLTPKDIYPYDKWKCKYAVPKANAQFMKGLDEIENDPDVLLYGKDPEAEELLATLYDFKRSTPDSVVSAPENKDISSSESENASTLRSRSRPPSQKQTPKTTKKRPVRDKESQSSNSPKYVKQDSTEVSDGNNINQQFILSDEAENRESSSLGPHEEVTRVKTPISGSESPSHNAPETNAVGRPMRKSASRFSAVRLLRDGAAIDDEKAVEDAGTTPKSPQKDKDASGNEVSKEPSSAMTASAATTPTEDQQPQASKAPGEKQKKEAKVKIPERSRRVSESASSSLSSSSGPDSGEKLSRKRHLKGDRQIHKKRRIVVSPHPVHRERVKSNSSLANKPRLKLSNVSMTPEELNDRLKSRRTSGQDQFKELDTEAKLHMIDNAIKRCLMRDREDIPGCLQRMGRLEKMELSLPLLVQCSSLVTTIRKCTRYKKSMEVRIAALKVLNRFLKIHEGASKGDRAKAQAVFLENSRKSANQNTSVEPTSVADIFKEADASQEKPAQPKTLKSSEPDPPKPEPSNSAESSTAPEGGSTSATVTVAETPVSPPPTKYSSPIPPSSSPPGVLSSPPRENSSPPRNIPNSPDSFSGVLKSDSEGLAASIGDVDEVLTIGSPEGFGRPHPSSDVASNRSSLETEAAMLAVRQAFLERTRRPSAIPGLQSFPPEPTKPTPYEPLDTHASSGQVPQSVDSYRPSRPSLPVDRTKDGARRTEPIISRPVRERARSPHALPHPLEHYQRCLREGVSQAGTSARPLLSHPPRQSAQITPHSYARAATEDLDTRIARMIGSATAHHLPHQPAQMQHLRPGISPYPPNPALLSRPSPSPVYPAALQHRPHMPPPGLLQNPGMVAAPRHHHIPPPVAPAAPAFTPASPESARAKQDDADPLNLWSPPPETRTPAGTKGEAESVEDLVYKDMDF